MSALDRAVTEEELLSARISRIQKFIDGDDGDDYIDLPVRDRSLLQEQGRYMVGYLDTLRKRIDRFKEQDSE